MTSTAPAGNPPVVTGISPSSVTANAGSTVIFTVTATGDAASYYWYKETGAATNLISGATTASLTLANVLAADIANYQVVLSNASGMSTSAVVSLTVIDPVLLTQPTSQTRLVGGTISFTVGVAGTQPLAYQWYVKPTADSNFTGKSPLSNGGRIAGADTNTLTITNLAYADATNFFAIVTNSFGSVTSSVVTLTIANSASLAFWDFNGNLNITNPVTAQGVGIATFTNCTTFSNNIASGNDFGAQNNGWGSSSYPTNGNAANNKTAGVRFNVSTLGAKNIAVSFDTRATSTASKYERLQYTTNGTDFIDYPTSSSFIQAVNYESRAFSLAGFPGVQNNTNFAIRIVTEFESTAKYGATNNANYFGNGGTYAAGGTVSYDIVNITGDAITNANTLPTVSSFTNVVTTDTEGATVLNFTIGDAETSPGSLTVSATSANQTVMPNGNLSLGGSGASRTLSLTPVSGGLGVAPILVTVTDGNGDSTATWFYVTVNPGNQPPTISGLVNTNMLGNITNTIGFTIGDDQTPVGNLTLTALSGNSTLVSNDVNHISFGGSGANRTLNVVPVTNQFGVTPITVTVNDGAKNTSVSFILEVRPNTDVVLNDGFDYDSSGSIVSVSGGFWQTHSGTPGQMQVGSGQVTVTDGNSEDVNAPLIGQPYNPTNNQVLYSSFTLNYSALPTEGGTYFSHFKDNTTSGFFDRIYVSTLNAAANTYRLGVGNTTGVTNTTAQIAQDLELVSNYTVITRLVLSNGVSTIWINPTSESSPGMTDTNVVASPGTIYAYALRESGGEGTMTIDDLKVGLSFSAVTGIALPIPLNIQKSGTNVVLTWSDASFNLQSSTNVSGPYVTIGGATSPFTTNTVQSQVFFRLLHP